MMGHFYFRADANKDIGAGHMMRCLTIAKALRDLLSSDTADAGDSHFAKDSAKTDAGQTGEITFLCADEESAKLPQREGFAVHVLQSDYRDMEAELSQITVLFQKETRFSPRTSPDNTIVVDSYFATDNYLSALRKHTRVVLIEDDLDHVRPVDLLVNYNFSADADAYHAAYEDNLTSGHPRLLIGTEYAPLRAQFTGRVAEIRKEVRNILILSGASDTQNAAVRIYSTLSNRSFRHATTSVTTHAGSGNDTAETKSPSVTSDAPALPDVHFHIVCGAYYPHAEELETLAKKDSYLHILHDVKDMASLMCGMDLCVSAGGSTLYELCATGLPFVCYCVADNQRPLCQMFANSQTAPYAGAFDQDASSTLEAIYDAVFTLAASTEKRLSQSLKQRALVDGKGAVRIARALTETSRNEKSASPDVMT